MQGLVRGAAAAEACDDVHAVEEAVQAQPRMSQFEYRQRASVSEGCSFWVPHGYGGRQAHILGRGLKEKVIALYQKVAKLGDHARQWNLRIFYLQGINFTNYLRF